MPNIDISPPRENIMKFTTRLISSPATRLLAAAWILALAGMATTLAQAQPTMPHRGAAMSGPMGGAGMGTFGGHRFERLLDSVGASADQKSRIRDIMSKAADEQRAQRGSSRSLHEQAMSLFTQPTVDAQAAEALRQQMMQRHDQSSRRWMQAMLDASAVLTPDQRGKLAERMKQRREMMERHQRERRALDVPKG
jgi:Spy/CpxP family protein refolding chaperone